MERYYSQFDASIPELADELKDFIVKINKFLLGLTDDGKYHLSQTRGQSSYSKVTFEDQPWKFEGQRHRKDIPLVDKATIDYRGNEAWRMTRRSNFIAPNDQTKDNIKHCLQGAAKNYDPKLPWHGPAHFIDKQTGLIYKALYSGTDQSFIIRETVCDSHGAPLWEAICTGGCA